MSVQRRPRLLAAVAIALCTIAVPAAAQLVTGSVAGTVNDSTGAVIPGATVTLISETRGTRLPEVITSTQRRLRRPERHRRPLHRPRHDGRLQDARTDRRQRQRRRPAGPRHLHHRARWRQRDRLGQERSAGHPGDQRRALVHDPDELGREPADRQPQLHRARLVRARRHAPPATRRASAAAATPTS